MLLRIIIFVFIYHQHGFVYVYTYILLKLLFPSPSCWLNSISHDVGIPYSLSLASFQLRYLNKQYFSVFSIILVEVYMYNVLIENVMIETLFIFPLLGNNFVIVV